MNRRYLLLLLFLLPLKILLAQPGKDSVTIPANDSITKAKADSAAITDSLGSPIISDEPIQIETMPDSIIERHRLDSGWRLDNELPPTIVNLERQIQKRHPYLGLTNEKLLIVSDIRQFHGKELLFYLLVLLLIIYACLRLLFPKYFNDLFRLFFRTTLKQRQIREQLMQTPLPSLLLNGFFVITGALYLSFVLQHLKLDPVNNFWLLSLYSAIGLAAIYFIKFLGLKFTGWLFNMKEAADSYIFIIFVINKMLGLFLLPFLVLLAFTQDALYPIALVSSYCMIGGLVAYRFILSYSAIRNQVRVNPFHFVLYLVAIEFLPLLLIYKGLLLFFRITA